MFFLLVLVTVAVNRALSSEELRTGVGMRPPSKRRPSESDRVTIDLSALRPSLPGLVLYEVGGGEGTSPKLVQVDLSTLNPQLQPHVIWPQFNEMELLDDRPFELDTAEAIPYLAGEESPLGHPRRMAKMSHWLDSRSAADAYNFVPDSLHRSLPLADEVIVPLDWEEKGKKKKRNVFLTNGWGAGGSRAAHSSAKSPAPNFATYYARARADRKHTRRREMESEERGRGSRGSRDLPRSEYLRQDNPQPPQKVRLSGQETWSLPQQYWNVPHLFGNEWQ